MQSTTKFFVVFLVAMLVASEVSEVSAGPAPEPRWKGWKKIERVGQHVRDGIIKAGPAVAVVGAAGALG